MAKNTDKNEDKLSAKEIIVFVIVFVLVVFFFLLGAFRPSEEAITNGLRGLLLR